MGIFDAFSSAFDKIVNGDKEKEQNVYQKNLSYTPEEKWYSGDTPTSSEALAAIYKVNKIDPGAADQLYQDFRTLQQDVSSPFYNAYSKPTSKAVTALADLGYDVAGGITDDFFTQNSYLMDHYRTGTGMSPLAPSSKSTSEQNAAYWYYQALQDREQTDKAEAEWKGLQYELAYKASRSIKNLSDDEIIDGIDWKKYPTLAKMDKDVGQLKDGVPLSFLRSIGYSRDAMKGVLWAARNGGSTGNPETDSVMATLGLGMTWKEDPDISAKLNPEDPAYNPYAVGSTLDEEMLYFDRTDFDDAFLQENRYALTGKDKTLLKSYQNVYKAEETTKAAEAELQALRAKIDEKLKYTTDPDRIIKSIDWKKDYPTLAKMDASLNNGILLPTTRAIDYRRQDMEAYIREQCAEYNTRKESTQFVADESKVLQTQEAPNAPQTAQEQIVVGESEKIINDAANNKINEAGSVIADSGTPEEKVVFQTAFDNEYDAHRDALTRMISKSRMRKEATYNHMRERADKDAVALYLPARAVISRQEAMVEERKELEDTLKSSSDLDPTTVQQINNRIADLDSQIEKGMPEYAEAVKTADKVIGEYALADTMYKRMGGKEADPNNSTINLLNTIQTLGENYVQPQWIPGEGYLAYMGQGNSYEKTLTEARTVRAQNELNLKAIDSVLMRIEESDIAVPESYIKNIRTLRDNLELELKAEDYFELRSKSDYKAEALKAASSTAKAWDRINIGLDLPPLIGDQEVDGYTYLDNLVSSVIMPGVTPIGTGKREGDMYGGARKEAPFIAVMNQYEAMNYFYLLNTEGRSAANDYWNYLTNPDNGPLNARVLGAREEWATQLKKDHPFLGNILEMSINGAQIESGMYVGSVLLNNLLASAGLASGTRDINPYNVTFQGKVTKEAVRAQTMKGIEDRYGDNKFLSGLMKFGYEVAESIGENLIDAATFGASKIGMMGWTATAGSIQDALINGATQEQALAIGAINGLAETITENIRWKGISSMFSAGADNVAGSTFRSVLKDILKEVEEEGIGEGVAEFVENLGDAFIAQETGNYKKRVDEYVISGVAKNREEAEKMASMDVVKSSLYAMAIGGASGLGSSAISFTSGKVSAKVGDAINREINILQAASAIRRNNPDVSRQAARQSAQSIVDTMSDVANEITEEPVTEPQTDQAASPESVTEPQKDQEVKPEVQEAKPEPAAEPQKERDVTEEPVTEAQPETEITEEPVTEAQSEAEVTEEPVTEPPSVEAPENPAYDEARQSMANAVVVLTDALDADESAQTAAVAAAMTPTMAVDTMVPGVSPDLVGSKFYSVAAQHLMADHARQDPLLFLRDYLNDNAESEGDYGNRQWALAYAILTGSPTLNDMYTSWYLNETRYGDLEELGATLLEEARLGITDPNVNQQLLKIITDNDIAQQVKVQAAQGAFDNTLKAREDVVEAAEAASKAQETLDEENAILEQKQDALRSAYANYNGEKSQEAFVAEAVHDVTAQESAVDQAQQTLANAQTAQEKAQRAYEKALEQDHANAAAQATQTVAAQVQAEAEQRQVEEQARLVEEQARQVEEQVRLVEEQARQVEGQAREEEADLDTSELAYPIDEDTAISVTKRGDTSGTAHQIVGFEPDAENPGAKLNIKLDNGEVLPVSELEITGEDQEVFDEEYDNALQEYLLDQLEDPGLFAEEEESEDEEEAEPAQSTAADVTEVTEVTNEVTEATEQTQPTVTDVTEVTEQAQPAAESPQYKIQAGNTRIPAAPQQTSAQDRAQAKRAKSVYKVAKTLARAIGTGDYIGAGKLPHSTMRTETGSTYNVLGYYSKQDDLIGARSSKAGSVSTVFHEIGHALGFKLGLTGTPEMIVALPDSVQEAYRDKPKDLKEEAFAEFFWQYAINPDAGRAIAGDAYVNDFERKIQQSPYAKAVNQGLADIRAYMMATDFARMASTIRDMSTKDRTGIKEWFRTMIDRNVDATNAAEAVSHAIREQGGQITHDVDIRKQALLANFARTRAYNNLTLALTNSKWQQIGDSLAKRLKDVGFKGTKENIEALSIYMKALHNLDRTREGKAMVDNETIDSQNAINQAKAICPKVVAAEEAFQNFRKEFMQAMLVDTGLISQDLMRELNQKYPHYVPGQKVLDQRTGRGDGTGGGQFKLREAHEATQDTWNPIQLFFKQVNQIVDTVSQNNVALAFDAAYEMYDLGEFARKVRRDTVTTTVDTTDIQSEVNDILSNASTDDDVIQNVLDAIGESVTKTVVTDGVNRPNIVRVVHPDGTHTFYEVADNELYRLLAGVNDFENSRNALLGAIGAVTKTMSALTTGNDPAFALRNFLRDFQTSVNWGSWATTYVDGLAKWAVAAFQVATKTGGYKDYLSLGGGGFNMIAPGNKKSNDDLMGNVFKGYNTQNVGTIGKLAGKAVWKTVTLGPVQEIIEQASRFAEFKSKRYDRGTAEGLQDAFIASQDVTVDFARRGNGNLVPTLANVIPFFSASVQGVYRTSRLLSEGERSRAPVRLAKNFINTAISSALCYGLLRKFLDKDEQEEYLRISPNLKASHFYIPNFAPETFGPEPLLRIPLAQDPATYLVNGVMQDALWSGSNDAVAIGSAAIAGVILDNLDPSGGSSIFSPVLNAAANRTYYGGYIVPTRLRDVDATLQYEADTPDAFVAASNVMSNTIGKKVSPMVLQYLAEQYTGFLGKTVIPMITKDKNTGEMAGINAAIRATQKRFTTDPLVSNQVSNVFYEGFNEIKTVVDAVNAGKPVNILRRGLTQDEADEAYKEAKELTGSKGALGMHKTAIKEYAAEIAKINANPDLTQQQKYDAVAGVRRRMIEETLRVNEVIAEYEEKYIMGKNTFADVIERMQPGPTINKMDVEKRSTWDSVDESFRADADKNYMKVSAKTWEMTGSASALPHPSFTFERTVDGERKKYEIPEDYKKEFINSYRWAYEDYIEAHYEEGMSTEAALTMLKQAHTKASGVAKKWYLDVTE